MAENREEILANFQGITAIEDVAEAIFHLEETNWDLLSAINRVMPQDGGSGGPSSGPDVEMIEDNDVNVIEPQSDPIIGPSSFCANPDVVMTENSVSVKGVDVIAVDVEDNNACPSTSSQNNMAKNTIHIQVLFANKIHPIEMSETATVSDLKKRIEAVCGVPLCRQQLAGIGGSKATPTTQLQALGLPSSGLVRLTEAGEIGDDDVAERLTRTYTLKVQHEEREYTLQYPGTKMVQEVKNDIYSLTDIPMRYQIWSGWPSVPDLDTMVLAMIGIEYPEHSLTLKRMPRPKEYKRIVVDSSESEDSSVEEFEDAADTFTAEDDIFVDNVTVDRLQALMPDDVQDEAIGCIEFSERFRQRYGPHCPMFFQGTLEDAIKEACMKPARERRLLGVYLHHDSSVLSNVFCAQLLGCDTVLQTLAANFIVYGWDLTFESNRNMLLTAVTSSLGAVACMTVRSIPVERLPALIIIMRVRSNTEIFSVINGNVGVSELLPQLVEAVERFAGARALDEKTERERDARNRVKAEQDEAYEQSLEADRAKEEFRKQVETERNQELQRAENERLIEEARKEEQRLSALQRLPSEPEEGTPEVTKIRVRLPPPHLNTLERRFLGTESLSTLLDYLASEGYHADTYKVISSWPRRDLTTLDFSSTLRDLKLFPQETIMLEER